MTPEEINNADATLFTCRMRDKEVFSGVYNHKQHTLHPHIPSYTPSKWEANLQARSVIHNNVWNSDDDDDEDGMPATTWLESIHALSPLPNDNSTWLPYFRNVAGPGSSSEQAKANGETVIEMKLSVLLTLFLKGTNFDAGRFPTVGTDGIWRLPQMEGNLGIDEHLFVQVGKDFVVKVA
ncbi:hypothetical protein BDP27DRAFT_1416583 [Rhodocollybia butyracea]|uniref:Uncharacterized protein n=1 Tax=Rhodocollybia butyracea TaxID=206335 RepID=A0A9P5Q4T1_9AGAR|nr:hypothetical protein BDP27DRAFT_1416583 [Rhodocollybia butyracea]